MATSPKQYALIVMNAQGPGRADNRMKGIAETISSEQPLIVFVQEFRWTKGLHSNTWRHHRTPKCYQYFGNKEAGFIFDTSKLTVSCMDNQAWVTENLDHKLKNKDEIPRISVSKIESRGTPSFQFLCASWHGPYKDCSPEEKGDTLDSLFKFLLRLREDNIPIILGGDFNFQASEIMKRMPHSFVPHRPDAPSKDMILTTHDFNLVFELSNVVPLRKNQDEEKKEPFDHTHLKMMITVKDNWKAKVQHDHEPGPHTREQTLSQPESGQVELTKSSQLTNEDLMKILVSIHKDIGCMDDKFSKLDEKVTKMVKEMSQQILKLREENTSLRKQVNHLEEMLEGCSV